MTEQVGIGSDRLGSWLLDPGSWLLALLALSGSLALALAPGSWLLTPELLTPDS